MSLIERAAERAEMERALGNVDQDLPGSASISESDESRIHMRHRDEHFLPLDNEPVTLSVPHLAAQGCLTNSDNVSALAQEYRRIKRPLLFNLRAQTQKDGQRTRGNLIMVTSAVPGEGKSFFSVNLALSIAAEIDQTVLLVDTDFTKRGAAAILGIDRVPGLLDVVVGERTVDEVLVQTDIRGFAFLPAGTSRSNADELFASDAMRSLITELSASDANRVLIFDTPPVFATNIPTTLVKMMGQVVFIVEADKSPQELVDDALNKLDGCEQIGLVLNKASRRMPGHSYDYGYGYG